uniref:FAD-binding domain-containing protein n=1 Tax=Chromera velia CCMP2878 TaxID=1169474 RepID=A0A0G4I060_9ALVE|eukprot:Cvel_1607.t1-p1 / transcript=Cvel_1607.t1 / gene=Cvel_1607 / organism=Chromera_velia_CCMP2878 / gene_product=hypothetical protein / transcript_product=hypothetical protein / location=Cvel_scaffold57:118348-119844(-) / protein_length=499 / sequence_SO=supercontig / SO=protein_coding / is_pseudo=false
MGSLRAGRTAVSRLNFGSLVEETGETGGGRPRVVIAGGGPAGLLCAAVLAKAGAEVSVHEKATSIEGWSDRSYAIVLNARGREALLAVDPSLHDRVCAVSSPRRATVMHGGGGGSPVVVPKNVTDFALTRSALVESLASFCASALGVGVRFGEGVEGVEEVEDDMLQVRLTNGNAIECTHVVGADGKWSAVRCAIERQGRFLCREHVCGSWGIRFNLSKCSSSLSKWQPDATHVFSPLTRKGQMYALASPLPDGRVSSSLVLFDSILKDFAWAGPLQTGKGGRAEDRGDWRDDTLSSQAGFDSDSARELALLLEKELPSFASFLVEVGGSQLVPASFGEDSDRNTLTSSLEELIRKEARRSARASWLEVCSPPSRSGSAETEEHSGMNCVGEPSLSALGGRVLLLGDSGHAMAPSLGEGCNAALESVSVLQSFIQGKHQIHQNGERFPGSKERKLTSRLSTEELSKAFAQFGPERAARVRNIQLRSATASGASGVTINP